MSQRPVTGARNELNSPLVPIANAKFFGMPSTFMRRMKFLNFGHKLFYSGISNEDQPSSDQSNRRRFEHSCKSCDSCMLPLSTATAALLEEDSHETCLSCSTIIVAGSQAAECPQCKVFLCAECFSTSPELIDMLVPQLKNHLKSINNNKLDNCRTKGNLLSRIKEIERTKLISELINSIPETEIHGDIMASMIGTPPSAGAQILILGNRNLLLDPFSDDTGIPKTLNEFNGSNDLLQREGQCIQLNDMDEYEVEVGRFVTSNLGMKFEYSESSTQGSETKVIVVSEVNPSSECMRIGIRKGDQIRSVNDDHVELELLGNALTERPLWIKLHRPDVNAPEAQARFVPPDVQIIPIIYYQRGQHGDFLTLNQSTAQLRRYGDAAYLKKMSDAEKIHMGSALDRAVKFTFTKRDIEENKKRSTGYVDTRAAGRMRAIEPRQFTSWNDSGIPLLLSFFDVGRKSNPRHDAAVEKSIARKFIPKARKREEYRQVVLPYIRRNMNKMKEYQASLSRGAGSESDALEGAVLSAIADVKLAEASKHQSKFIEACTDEAWRQKTPEVLHF